MNSFKQLIIYCLSLPFRILCFCRQIDIKSGKRSLVMGGVKVKGKNERIRIGNNTHLIGCKFVFKGCHNEVYIGHNVRLKNVVFWIEDDNNKIVIGDGTTMEGNTQLAACEGTNILIGADCMLAFNVNMRTTDSHSILNTNGERINPAADIRIGNRVWIGTQSLILKGSYIPDNCIIGACSLFTSNKAISSNCIYCGNPAKIVKRDINWTRKRLSCNKNNVLSKTN